MPILVFVCSSERQILRGMLFFLFVCFTLVMININIAIISITRPSQKMLSDESTAKNVKCPNTTFFWIHNGKDEKKPTLSHQVSEIFVFLPINSVGRGIAHKLLPRKGLGAVRLSIRTNSI